MLVREVRKSLTRCVMRPILVKYEETLIIADETPLLLVDKLERRVYNQQPGPLGDGVVVNEDNRVNVTDH